MKQGFKVLDADLHVIEPHDLYLKYMDPKWGDRIPRAEPRKLNIGELHDFRIADGSLVRKPWREAPPQGALSPSNMRMERRKAQIAPDYAEAVERQFDP
ncbi:MAG TPA: hypothetical protein VKK81_20035, partial [Candidatus Binatia bacterium]|nr:hypothetical protein [Candidatus Binatia bacterium]